MWRSECDRRSPADPLTARRFVEGVWRRGVVQDRFDPVTAFPIGVFPSLSRPPRCGRHGIEPAEARRPTRLRLACRRLETDETFVEIILQYRRTKVAGVNLVGVIFPGLYSLLIVCHTIAKQTGTHSSVFRVGTVCQAGGAGPASLSGRPGWAGRQPTWAEDRALQAAHGAVGPERGCDTRSGRHRRQARA